MCIRDRYINGYENGSGINLSIENAKIFLRSKVPSYAKKHGREAAIKEYAKQSVSYTHLSTKLRLKMMVWQLI